LIKINLVREGRAVRGTGVAQVAAVQSTVVVATPAAPTNINNIIIVVFLVIGLLAAGGYWWYYKGKLAQKEETVQQKTDEAKKLEGIIKEVETYQRRKDSLQQRIDLINQLKQNQKGPVRIMDQISKDLPDLVWLDAMDISGGRIALNGRGLNPNAIALFIENIKRDPYFEEPSVGTVALASSSPTTYSFDMNFAFTYAPKTTVPPAGTPPTTTTTTSAAPAAQ